jgi:hypothetical protein
MRVRERGPGGVNGKEKGAFQNPIEQGRTDILSARRRQQLGHGYGFAWKRKKGYQQTVY